MVFLFAYGALVFDLAIGFLLVWKRSRPLAIVLAGAFHFINANLFQIGIFPYLAFAATLSFAEPDWPRRMYSRLESMVTPQRVSPSSPSRRFSTGATGNWQTSGSATWAVLAIGHLYLLSQLLIPLRHFLYPGNVSWTEEGHRFSWHMKLRDKEAILRVFVTDPRSGETWEVSPAVDLSAKQLDEMSTRPDMVLQYAHYLAERLTLQSGARPIIRVDHRVSLNGRPYQTVMDPAVDLAAVSGGFAPANWILPLETPLEGGSAQGTY